MYKKLYKHRKRRELLDFIMNYEKYLSRYLPESQSDNYFHIYEET